jgi:hypothetical protein
MVAPGATRARVAAFVALAASAAVLIAALTADDVGRALSQHPTTSVAYLIGATLLQHAAIKVPARGAVSVSAVGLIASGIALGAGAAMAIAVAAAIAQYLWSRGNAYKALFDASNFALAAAAATGAYTLVGRLAGGPAGGVAAAVAAGLAYTAVNNTLLCTVMGVAETRSPLVIWNERFRWASPYFLNYGPLALLLATAYNAFGPASLLIALPPPMILRSAMHLKLQHSREHAGART